MNANLKAIIDMAEVIVKQRRALMPIDEAIADADKWGRIVSQFETAEKKKAPDVIILSWSE